LLRFLLVEAAQAAARIHPDWRRRYTHLAMRRHKNIAKVAMGRRIAIKLYWMWRNGCEYSQSVKFWASRSLKREFEEVIVVEGWIEEMYRSD
jgi:hypothetical protein